MKKLGLTLLAAGFGLMLGGCTGDGSGTLGIGQSVAASMLNNQCHNYANEQQLWKAAKLMLGSQAQQYEDKICSCASDEASRNMTASQMVGLANESSRAQTLVDMIGPTFSACYQKLVR